MKLGTRLLAFSGFVVLVLTYWNLDIIEGSLTNQVSGGSLDVNLFLASAVVIGCLVAFKLRGLGSLFVSVLILAVSTALIFSDSSTDVVAVVSLIFGVVALGFLLSRLFLFLNSLRLVTR